MKAWRFVGRTAVHGPNGASRPCRAAQDALPAQRVTAAQAGIRGQQRHPVVSTRIAMAHHVPSVPRRLSVERPTGPIPFSLRGGQETPKGFERPTRRRPAEVLCPPLEQPTATCGRQRNRSPKDQRGISRPEAGCGRAGRPILRLRFGLKRPPDWRSVRCGHAGQALAYHPAAGRQAKACPTQSRTLHPTGGRSRRRRPRLPEGCFKKEGGRRPEEPALSPGGRGDQDKPLSRAAGLRRPRPTH